MEVLQYTRWFDPQPKMQDVLGIWLEMTFAAFKPQVAEAAVVCAIPAWFDLRLLALLTDSDQATAVVLLYRLLSEGLATTLPDGGYAYFPHIRARLLEMWRSPDGRARYGTMVSWLAEYYLNLTQEQVLRLHGPDAGMALEMLDRFYPNLEAVWEAAMLLGNAPLVRRLVTLLDEYHTRRELWAQKARWLEGGIAACEQLDDAAMRAEMLNGLGIALMQLSGDRLANTRRAVACYEACLKVYTPQTSPLNYAMIQNNLGNAYLAGVSGDPRQDLPRAVACYREALRMCAQETAPSLYAMIQSNLGFAYAELPGGERAGNLREAIVCYREALKVYTAAAAPQAYAKLQLGMASAYANLSTCDFGAHGEHLRAAIACYEVALLFYRQEQAPLQYAQIQADMGNAYALLDGGERAALLARAIACYETALRYFTLEEYPHSHAELSMALGMAYSQLPALGDDEDVARLHTADIYMERAIACYHDALSVYTPPATAFAYAQAQVYLGMAYAHLHTGNRTRNLQRALIAYLKSLRIFTYANNPQAFAKIHTYLGETYMQLAEVSGERSVEKAIVSYEHALRFYTPDVAPQTYANIKNNLGILYAQLQSRNVELNLRKSIACFREALRFWSASGIRDVYVTRENLKSVYEALACLYASRGEMQRVDELYQEVQDQYTDDGQRSHFWMSISAGYFQAEKPLGMPQACQGLESREVGIVNHPVLKGS